MTSGAPDAGKIEKVAGILKPGEDTKGKEALKDELIKAVELSGSDSLSTINFTTTDGKNWSDLTYAEAKTISVQDLARIMIEVTKGSVFEGVIKPFLRRSTFTMQPAISSARSTGYLRPV